MAVWKIVFLCSLLLACAKTEKPTNKNEDSKPEEISSRFFDLGGIINQLFPGFNHGNQGHPVGNPSGMGFPANSQQPYPGAPIQNPNPQVPQSGGTWPVIDDASQYPNQRPPQQYPGGGSSGMYPQQGNSMVPNQGGYGGMQNSQFPQGGQSQYPQGGQSQYPQYPNQKYPQNGQGNFGGTQYPNNGGGMQNQYPGQGGNWNQNPNTFGSGQSGGGSAPPQENNWNSNQPTEYIPDQQGPGGMGVDNMPSGENAILGRPVSVPPNTEEPGRIFFPSSTESPARRQCVQDCETTTEYDPVCGSDDITYINPQKLVCARNCGHNVFVVQQGRCPNEERPIPKNAITTPLVFAAL